jgi:putative ABC transport system permease protein
MSPLGMAFAYLRDRPLTTFFNVLLFALGSAVATALLLFTTQMRETLTRDGEGIDLVVGAKGGSIQLILSSVFHADIPSGNISWADYQRVADHPAVARAIPLALGDSFRGYRVVGTTDAYVQLYGGQLAEGRMFQPGKAEAVIGADVARSVGIPVGDRFVATHGMTSDAHQHDYQPIEVVGRLAPTGTVLDRLVVVPIEAVWAVHSHGHGGTHAADKGNPATDPVSASHDHEHEHAHEHGHDHDHAHAHDGANASGDAPTTGHGSKGDVTAVLVTYTSPIAAANLPREINQMGAVQAAAPAWEMNRLLVQLGLGFDLIQAFAWTLVGAAALSVFISALSALRERRGDLALMRVMGATRTRLMSQIMLEGMLKGLVGGLLGIAAGHALIAGLGSFAEQAEAFRISAARILPEEGLILAASVLLGALAAAAPAIAAYRTDPARTLAGQ